MQPTIGLNWLAIIVAVAASFAVGSVWYGMVFRELWQRSMGMTMTPTSSELIRSSIIGIVGTILMAIALAWLIGGWRATAWGSAGPDAPRVTAGIVIGLIAWAGFIIPSGLNNVAYERSNWTRFALGAGYQLASILVMALILALWR